MSVENPTTEDYVKAYIKMRDARAELKKAYEEKDNGLKTQMEAVETELLEITKALGANSINTSAGTVIKGVKSFYWSSDWSEMHKFVVAKQAPELLEKRISQSAMKEYLEAHPDDMPPGLNVEAKYSITVRRASSK